MPTSAGSARRVPAPGNCVTGPPHVTTAASARLGPGRTFCRPGDVSASGVAWLPRCSPVPLPLFSPGETDAVTAGLGCVRAAGIPPSRHTSSSPGHASLPPRQPRRFLFHLSNTPPRPRYGKLRWRWGWDRVVDHVHERVTGGTRTVMETK